MRKHFKHMHRQQIRVIPSLIRSSKNFISNSWSKIQCVAAVAVLWHLPSVNFRQKDRKKFDEMWGVSDPSCQPALILYSWYHFILSLSRFSSSLQRAEGMHLWSWADHDGGYCYCQPQTSIEEKRRENERTSAAPFNSGLQQHRRGIRKVYPHYGEQE